MRFRQLWSLDLWRLRGPRYPDDARVTWLCSVIRCNAPGVINDPDVGHPLCKEHHRDWRAQAVGWQT